MITGWDAGGRREMVRDGAKVRKVNKVTLYTCRQYLGKGKGRRRRRGESAYTV